ncbi:GCN5-related N-acetyltransferase domain protein, partial [mine drainage metagenome]
YLLRTHQKQGVGIIEELYIYGDYRGKGIGKELVKKALDYLDKHAIVAVVTTGGEMEDAQKFYEAIGFKKSKEWYYHSLPRLKGDMSTKQG